MLKLIFSLIWGKASKKQWQLEIGAHLLKKGCGYYIGQIVREKKLDNSQKKVYKVKVVTGLFYDFKTNKVNHTLQNKILEAKV